MGSGLSAAEEAFGAYVGRQALPQGVIERASFADLSPETAAERIVALRRDRGQIAENTGQTQRNHWVWLLRLMARKGRDIATMDARFLHEEFRPFLRDCFEGKIQGVAWSKSHVGGMFNTFNAAMRDVFGDLLPRGVGLQMIGCGVGARDDDPISEEEYRLLIKGIKLDPFSGPERGAYHRAAFLALFETVLDTAARDASSLLVPEFTWECIRWQEHYIHLEKVKYGGVHDPVITDRALAALHALGTLASHRGLFAKTKPVFLYPDGQPISPDFFTKGLTRIRRRAGINRPIYPHLLRKTTGAQLVEKAGEKAAAAQLRVSLGVLRRHYSKTSARRIGGLRSHLPGANWAPTTAEEERQASIRLLQEGVTDPISYEMEAALRRIRDLLDRSGGSHRSDGTP